MPTKTNLIPGLYTFELLSAADSSASFEVQFNPDHPLYAGHFPGQAVTPGVCLIQTATELLSEARGKPFQLTAARQIKFLQMHHPTDPLRFECSWTEENLGLNGRIALFQNHTCIAKIHARFEPA